MEGSQMTTTNPVKKGDCPDLSFFDFFSSVLSAQLFRLGE
jgi:hypothetical protein